MRRLLPPPQAVLDPASGAPASGSYQGSLPRIDYRGLGGPSRGAAGPVFRLLHHKRWFYVAVQSEARFLGAAIVDLGYVGNGFVLCGDTRAGRVLWDHAVLAPPWAVRVGDCAADEAELRGGGARLHLSRTEAGGARELTVEASGLRLRARLSPGAAPPISAITAPGQLGAGLCSATEKQALLLVEGELILDGVRHSLDGGLGGLDYTNGLLARHTAWRWAFLLGHAQGGQPVALNLVQGFVGAAECAVWVGDQLIPLGEGRMQFDPDRPAAAPWHIVSEGGDGGSRADLRFVPVGAHEERRDLGIAAARFVQPVGRFEGTIRLGGQGAGRLSGTELVLHGVPGVVEDQDVRW